MKVFTKDEIYFKLILFVAVNDRLMIKTVIGEVGKKVN